MNLRQAFPTYHGGDQQHHDEHRIVEDPELGPELVPGQQVLTGAQVVMVVSQVHCDDWDVLEKQINTTVTITRNLNLMFSDNTQVTCYYILIGTP